ncbi:hypothetical protein [Roseateles sp.]|uniref:hypothetical protein n=1 Tax=Roseateles sp. TaxID=1971397 RepID=UPI00286CD159|nr:hypothetical protein [Roseateles sp.]
MPASASASASAQAALNFGKFLQGKVELARTSMQAGQGQSNDQVEAEFAARRAKVAGPG